MLETVLVGIPLVFVLISIAEMGRAMWAYHTMAYAMNVAARYVVVHGKTATVSSVAHQIKQAAIGLSDSSLNVTLTSASGSVNCTPLNSCYNNNNAWPPTSDNSAGNDIQISGKYPFHSALSMFWPHAGTVAFAPIYLPANSKQAIQY